MKVLHAFVGYFALTQPTGRAQPRHSQYHASAGCSSQPPKPRFQEEEAVFISVVNTNEDPPNAHQEEEEVVFTRENRGGRRRRRRRLSLLVL